MPWVTADATDEEILAAIDEAGEHRHKWRGHDWPEEGEEKSWIIVSDIGETSSSDRRLFRRLMQLVASGKVERRTYSSMPRFRVVRKKD